MTLGKLFIASISSGIVTQEELRWVAINQLTFSKSERVAASKLGELIDSGQILIGRTPEPN